MPRNRVTRALVQGLGAAREGISAGMLRLARRRAGPLPGATSLPRLRRIAVLHFHAIGDLLMATPAIRAIALRHPGAELHVICQPACLELLAHSPYVRHVRSQGQSPHRRHPSGFLDWIGHLLFLRRGGYDAVVEMTGLPQSAWLAYGSGAPIRAGIALPGRERSSGWPLLTRILPWNPTQHFIEGFLGIARLLDAPPAGDEMDLEVGDEARQRVAFWLGGQGLLTGRVCVIHPGAKWPPKRWGAARYAELATWLQAECDLEPVLVGEALDRPVLDAIRAAAPGTRIFDAGGGLLGLGALLERAALFVGNDSGPMHIARACRTPTVAVFGPTDPRRTGPRGAAAEAVLDPVECRPCQLYFTADRCQRGQAFCMEGVTLAAVQAAVRRVLAVAAPRDLVHPARTPHDSGRPPVARRRIKARLRRWADSPGGTRLLEYATDLVKRLADRPEPIALALCYHRIVRDSADDLTPPGLCVARDDLERQLDFLQERFRLLPPSGLVAAVHEGRLAAAAAALTFDDGFREDWEIAAPVLEARGLRAAFFVAPAHVGSGEWMWHYRLWRAQRLAGRDGELPASWRLPLAGLDNATQRATLAELERALGIPGPPAERQFMSSWEQICSLARRGHEIGAHTLTHPALQACSPEERRAQIAGSRSAIARATATGVSLFCYPFGHSGTFPDDVVTAVREAGFAYAFTTQPGLVRRGDPWRIPRLAISRNDGLVGFLAGRLIPVLLAGLRRRGVEPVAPADHRGAP